MIPILARLAPFSLACLSSCIFVVHDGHSDLHGWTSRDEVMQGSGIAVTESRDVAPFRALAAHGPIDVDVRIGTPQSVTVRADQEFVEWIATDVHDGVLAIEWKPARREGASFVIGPRVEITVPALERVSLDGIGDVRVTGLSGGSFGAEVTGAGDLRASGRVDELSVYSSGMGDVAMFDLEARSANVSVTGAADVELFAVERLRATVTGLGDVRYRGHPEVSRSITGPGSVERARE